MTQVSLFYPLLEFHFSWNDIGYYFAVSVAFIIVFGLIESVLLYMFDTTGESRGVIGLLLDLIEAIFNWIGDKIIDLYDDIVFAIENRWKKK